VVLLMAVMGVLLMAVMGVLGATVVLFSKKRLKLEIKENIILLVNSLLLRYSGTFSIKLQH
jgi:hypothetical protein